MKSITYNSDCYCALTIVTFYWWLTSITSIQLRLLFNVIGLKKKLEKATWYTYMVNVREVFWYSNLSKISSPLVDGMRYKKNLQCYVSVLEWRIKEVQRYLWLLSWKWAMTSHCVQMVRIKRGSWSKTGSTPPSMHGDRIGKYTSCYVLHLRWRDNQEQLPKIHYVATSSYVAWRKLLECIVSVLPTISQFLWDWMRNEFH